MSPEATKRMSVILCSLNGEAGVDRCLTSLREQTIARSLEVILVDDGSTDATAQVGAAHGAIVRRHERNLGLAAARNTGVRAASAPIVAFLDDDVIAARSWAEELLHVYDEQPGRLLGVGGRVVALAGPGPVGSFIERNNPLRAIEADVSRSSAALYRLLLYLQSLWSVHEPDSTREVYSLVGANMSFPREVLLDAGLFDSRFTFGAEELDICVRLRSRWPDGRLISTPAATVEHHFERSLRDVVRRARSYGVGSARMARKWPGIRAAIFPLPLAELCLAVWATRRPRALFTALALPQLWFLRSFVDAVATQRPELLLHPYIRLAQETGGNAGTLLGWWRYRAFETPPRSPAMIAPTLLSHRWTGFSPR